MSARGAGVSRNAFLVATVADGCDRVGKVTSQLHALGWDAVCVEEGCAGIGHFRAASQALSDTATQFAFVVQDDAVATHECTAERLDALLAEARAHAGLCDAVAFQLDYGAPGGDWGGAWGRALSDGALVPTASPMFLQLVPNRTATAGCAVAYARSALTALGEHAARVASGGDDHLGRALCAPCWGCVRHREVRLWVPAAGPLFTRGGSGGDAASSEKGASHLVTPPPESSKRSTGTWTRAETTSAPLRGAGHMPEKTRPRPPILTSFTADDLDVLVSAYPTQPTVSMVTAFFPVPSKQPPAFYLRNAPRLLNNVQAHVVIFTTKEYEPALRSMRGGLPTSIFCLDVDSFGLPETPLKNWFSSTTWKKAPEWARRNVDAGMADYLKPVSVQLMQLWLSKPWFVQEALRLDPACAASEFVFWCDVGCIRYDEVIPMVRLMPSVSQLQAVCAAYACSGTPNVLMFNQRRQDPISGLRCMHGDSVIAAGMIVGPPPAWRNVLDDLRAACEIGVRNTTLYEETCYFIMATVIAPSRYRMQPWGLRVADLPTKKFDPMIVYAGWVGGAILPTDFWHTSLGWPTDLPIPVCDPKGLSFGAVYGPGTRKLPKDIEDGPSLRWKIDVTKRLLAATRQLSYGASMTIVVSNETMGADPAKGELKLLTVQFVFGGTRFQVSVGEGETFKLRRVEQHPLATATADYDSLAGDGLDSSDAGIASPSSASRRVKRRLIWKATGEGRVVPRIVSKHSGRT